MHADIQAYNERQTGGHREACSLLASEISRGLPEAEGKVWHGHPVWFLDGNPIVGYSRLKDGMRLMFWSGQSFAAPGLEASGSFQAADVLFVEADDVDTDAVAAWLAESRAIQWDYENIRRNRGLVKRTAF